MRVLAIDVGIKNLAFCYMENTPQSGNVLWWDNVVVTDLKKPPLETLVQALTSKLSDMFAADQRFDTADVVLIENQPMNKNGTMKTVAVAIFTFFVMLKQQHGTVDSVRFMSPMSKLKCAKAPPPGRNLTYKERKHAAIEMVRRYLVSHSRDDQEWFGRQKKKDDLADAFLMAQYHIENEC